MSGHWLTSDEIHTARLLRREGKTLGGIARHLGRDRETIRDACKGLARMIVHDAPVVVAPDHVLAERDRTLARAPRDLTAAIRCRGGVRLTGKWRASPRCDRRWLA
jgi:hypothetical protein